MRKGLLIVLSVVWLEVGCDHQRIVELEKENAELREAAKKKATAEEFDFQSKCSADGLKMFADWESVRKDAPGALDYKSHYNRASNKCFILMTETVTDKRAFDESVNLMNVYENTNDAEYWERTEQRGLGEDPLHRLYSCRVADKKCETHDEFDKLLKPFMTE